VQGDGAPHNFACLERILLSLDMDFGELAFRSGLPAVGGVILFRLTPSSPENISKIAASRVCDTHAW